MLVSFDPNLHWISRGGNIWKYSQYLPLEVWLLVLDIGCKVLDNLFEKQTKNVKILNFHSIVHQKNVNRWINITFLNYIEILAQKFCPCFGRVEFWISNICCCFLEAGGLEKVKKNIHIFKFQNVQICQGHLSQKSNWKDWSALLYQKTETEPSIQIQ